MKIHRLALAILAGLFLAIAIGSAPASANEQNDRGGDIKERLFYLDIEEGYVRDDIAAGNYYLMQEEFGFSVVSVVILNLQVLNALKLRQIQVEKAALSRELLHIRMQDFMLNTPAGLLYTLQMLSIFTVIGSPIYTNFNFTFDPILWQASVALASLYFITYLSTPEGRGLVANLTQVMSKGQYGGEAVYDANY